MRSLIAVLQIGQFLIFFEHESQHARCPHGRKRIPTTALRQTLHSDNELEESLGVKISNEFSNFLWKNYLPALDLQGAWQR